MLRKQRTARISNQSMLESCQRENTILKQTLFVHLNQTDQMKRWIEQVTCKNSIQIKYHKYCASMKLYKRSSFLNV